MTSNASSIVPRTASSTSLVQLASNVSTIDGLEPLAEKQDSPLTTIANKLPYLAESQQEPIRRTLELINLTSHTSPDPSQTAPDQSPTLLLAHSWTLFFSDTSISKSTTRGHHHSHSQRDHTSLLKAAEYQSGMSQVFTGIGDVESLCASLAGFKRTIAEGVRKGNLVGPPPTTPHSAGIHSPSFRRSFASSELPGTSSDQAGPLEDSLVVPGNGLGLIAMKPGHNLHFFRVGVNPVWEDPWNAKGGRLTIATPLAALDPTFEAIVLLIAGGVLETDANRKLAGNATADGKSRALKEGGRVVGVVGSRRRGGDRIEIWLSGPTIGSPPSEEWIRIIQNVLLLEIGSPEIRSARYKKHL